MGQCWEMSIEIWVKSSSLTVACDNAPWHHAEEVLLGFFPIMFAYYLNRAHSLLYFRYYNKRQESTSRQYLRLRLTGCFKHCITQVRLRSAMHTWPNKHITSLSIWHLIDWFIYFCSYWLVTYFSGGDQHDDVTYVVKWGVGKSCVLPASISWLHSGQMCL